MNDERNRDQIVRKDARGCFVESLSDAFGIGKAHFAFAAYDMKRPSDSVRPTAYTSTWMSANCWSCAARPSPASYGRCCAKSGSLASGEQSTSTSAARRLKGSLRWAARPDGMSLSRTFQLLPGAKSGFLLVADSGAGEENSKG